MWGSESITAKLKSGTGQVPPPFDQNCQEDCQGRRIIERGPEVANHTATDPQQGIRGLGVPIGREEFVKNQLAKKIEEHQMLRDRRPLVQDLQATWLLLFHCDSQPPILQTPTTDKCGSVSISCGDRECLSESAAAHHDVTVTRTHGVELRQEGPRVSTLVELGRFSSNDLELPPWCRDNNDPWIERPSHTKFPRN